MEKQLFNMAMFVDGFEKGRNEYEDSLMKKPIGVDAIEKKIVNDAIIIPVPVCNNIDNQAVVYKKVYSYFWNITQQCTVNGKSSFRSLMLVYAKYSLYSNCVNNTIVDEVFNIFNS